MRKQIMHAIKSYQAILSLKFLETIFWQIIVKWFDFKSITLDKDCVQDKNVKKNTSNEFDKIQTFVQLTGRAVVQEISEPMPDEPQVMRVRPLISSPWPVRLNVGSISLAMDTRKGRYLSDEGAAKVPRDKLGFTLWRKRKAF